ncbi:peptidoglycan DD-metalloendopeptidase family protein [Desertibacillus haloalkaliphilus]|uniref:peptidoglycan DD-metalloendopeptidase family protein n=1 Tax=Desertibacillus haloalkaliphilus TaxID=1328930 RepID=UPI001C25F920|nr:peptidoglycan DD-metalloendopeptidase family protein [Desertibacillus haloalkaliphilus]MBU8908688.1 peptidoglycan DD-metalloendopeptidase family protein [Desertibacillus haloalkaliphilus]
MKRKAGIVFLAFGLGVSGLFTGVGGDRSFANSSLEERLEGVQSERSQKQQEAEQTEAEIQKLEEEMRELEEEIREIDEQMTQTNQNIREKKEEIEEVRERIEELREQIAILEERIAERDTLLKDRVRSMYQTGGSVNYLEVLLGAQSFGDFLDRIGALTTIATQDRNILEAHIEDQNLLEETKEQVEEELATLEGHLIQLEELMDDLEGQLQQKDRVMERLQKEEDDLHGHLGELEDAESVLAQQEQAIQQELEAYRERQRQQERARQNNTNNSSSANQVIGNGTLARPAEGRNSSNFGWRVHPVHGGQRLHRGMDIANSTGTPIYASESGTVITSRYMSGYGNTVMISHNIDGQVLTTLYAHLDSLTVSSGDRVGRGDQIGRMGQTGTATGPHLHFEVHEGPWNGDANAVDPRNYLD